jgi:hypothetical protein
VRKLNVGVKLIFWGRVEKGGRFLKQKMVMLDVSFYATTKKNLKGTIFLNWERCYSGKRLDFSKSRHDSIGFRKMCSMFRPIFFVVFVDKLSKLNFPPLEAKKT